MYVPSTVLTRAIFIFAKIFSLIGLWILLFYFLYLTLKHHLFWIFRINCNPFRTVVKTPASSSTYMYSLCRQEHEFETTLRRGNSKFGLCSGVQCGSLDMGHVNRVQAKLSFSSSKQPISIFGIVNNKRESFEYHCPTGYNLKLQKIVLQESFGRFCEGIYVRIFGIRF